MLVFYIIDIDECALQTSGCNQICANTNGSFVCSCNAGFQMLPDNKTCTGMPPNSLPLKRKQFNQNCILCHRY